MFFPATSAVEPCPSGPSEDPEWWADLASQLPAAWGNGAFDTARPSTIWGCHGRFMEGDWDIYIANLIDYAIFMIEL